MRMMSAGLSLAFLAGVAAFAPAQAGPLPEGGVTANEVAGVMRAMKLPVEQTTDRQGDPLILSAISGRKFGVYFYQCQGGRCGSIQFSAGFDDAASIPIFYCVFSASLTTNGSDILVDFDDTNGNLRFAA